MLKIGHAESLITTFREAHSIRMMPSQYIVREFFENLGFLPAEMLQYHPRKGCLQILPPVSGKNRFQEFLW
jgi:hypothetical protein